MRPRGSFLAQRVRSPELMDDPALGVRAHEAALRGLARLNRVSGIRGPIWRELRELAGGARCGVVDVAAGSGDLVVSLGRRAEREGVPISFTACDISDVACASIRDRAGRAGIAIEVRQGDVLRDDVETCDVAMCHLFLHHLDDEQIVSLLGRMRRAARRGVIVTDLVRSQRGYALAWLASRFLTRSRVVRVDALLSVRAALTPAELRALASRAGVEGVMVRRVWPERMLLRWEAPR